MNKVVLMGRMTADPELRTTQSGISVTKFTLAVERPYAKKGEDKQVDWLDVVAWRQTAEFICKYFGKGDPIAVAGALQSRNYEDKEGKNHKVLEVLAEAIEFVPKTKDKPKTETKSPDGVAPAAEDFTVIEDEDVPF